MVVVWLQSTRGGDSYLDSRNRRRSDKEFNMVDFLIMSLLVTLCLERISPVNLTGSATDRYVAIMPERISSNEARIVWDALIER